jgi:hypothetical protein
VIKKALSGGSNNSVVAAQDLTPQPPQLPEHASTITLSGTLKTWNRVADFKRFERSAALERFERVSYHCGDEG